MLRVGLACATEQQGLDNGDPHFQIPGEFSTPTEEHTYWGLGGKGSTEQQQGLDVGDPKFKVPGEFSNPSA